MTTITQAITPLPAVPDPATMSPTVFSTTAAAFVLAQKAEAVELETFRGQVNTVAGEMAANAATASSSATAAAASAISAVAASGVSIWVSGTTYAIGDNRFSPANFQTYRRKTVGAGTTDPSLDGTNWQSLTAISGFADTDPSIVGAFPRWVKVGSAISYTAFQTAALTKTNTLFSLIAAGAVHGIKLKTSTAFVGASISAMTLAVGISGTNDKYLTDFDVLSAVSGTNFSLSQAMGTESHTGATNITITATAVGANLSALTAGAVDVWALLSTAL